MSSELSDCHLSLKILWLSCLHTKIPAKPSVPLIALSYITPSESIWPWVWSLLVGEITLKNKRVEHEKQTKHTHTRKTKQTKPNQTKNQKVWKTQTIKRGSLKKNQIDKKYTTSLKKNSQNPAKALPYHTGKGEEYEIPPKLRCVWGPYSHLLGHITFLACTIWTNALTLDQQSILK